MLETASFTVAPKHYPGLAGFCCGTRRERHEVEVDKIVAEFYAGERDDAEVRVTESGGRLVGLVGIGFQPATFEHPSLVEPGDYAHIPVIGISHHFRRGGEHGPLPGDVPLGDLILLDALAQIEKKWGARIRGVLGQIASQNRDGCELAKRHGFTELFPASAPEYDSWYRRLSR
ncbi:MAG: hypothetical protein ACYDHN_00675 [Solirubrobacteraceae bacterium]